MINKHVKRKENYYITEKGAQDAEFTLCIRPNKYGTYDVCNFSTASDGGIRNMWNKLSGRYRVYNPENYIFVTRNVIEISESTPRGVRTMSRDSFKTHILAEMKPAALSLLKEDFK